MKAQISILLFFAFALTFVSSQPQWPLNKEMTCNLFNITGMQCDVYWCDNINGGNYSIDKEMCIFFENQTVNDTNLTTACNLSNYYTKDEIHKLIGIDNSTNKSLIVLAKEYSDNLSTTLAVNVAQTIENKTVELSNRENSVSSQSQWSPWQIIIVVAVIFGLIAFLVYSSSQSKKNPTSKAWQFRRSFGKDAQQQNQNIPVMPQQNIPVYPQQYPQCQQPVYPMQPQYPFANVPMNNIPANIPLPKSDQDEIKPGTFAGEGEFEEEEIDDDEDLEIKQKKESKPAVKKNVKKPIVIDDEEYSEEEDDEDEEVESKTPKNSRGKK